MSPHRVPDEAPPSLPRIPSGTVLLVPGYYEVLRRPVPFSPRFVCLRVAIPARAPVFVSPCGPTPAGGLELSGLAAPRQSFRTGDPRASQVPGEPRCAYALFLDPGRTAASGHTTSAAWPPLVARRRLPRSDEFRGSIAGPGHALSTLRRLGYPKAAQDSLLGAWPASQAGLVTRRVPTKGFRFEWHCRLPGLDLRRKSTSGVTRRADVTAHDVQSMG